jgi:hypothetical protein
MSQIEDEERLELHVMTAPGPVDELVELLTVTTDFHRTGHRLGLGHAVNFGRPWVSGSTCTHGLISLPYLDGPDLEWLDCPRVRFLWLIPVTAAEVAYKKELGLEALESRFEEAQLDYLDPFRASVVLPGARVSLARHRGRLPHHAVRAGTPTRLATSAFPPAARRRRGS